MDWNELIDFDNEEEVKTITNESDESEEDTSEEDQDDTIIDADEESEEESEETEEESEEEGSEEDPTEEESKGDPELQAYYDYLVENEVLVLPEDFEFDGTNEKLQEAFNVTKTGLRTSAIEQIWEALPEDFKPLLSYGLQGGTSLDDYINTYRTADIENLDLEDTISQRLAITEYYKILHPNKDSESIQKMVDKVEKISDLKEEAEDAVNYIKGLREEQRQNFLAEQAAERQRQEEAAEEYRQTLKDAIKNSKDFDLGTKNKVEAMLFNSNQEVPEFNSKLNSVYQNPEHFVQLVALLADYDERTGFTFNRLKKQLKTQTNKNFSEYLKSKVDNKSKVSGTSKNQGDFDFSKFVG